MDLAALEPGEALAVRRDGDLADGKATVEAGEDLVELGGTRRLVGEGGSVGVLRADRQGKDAQRSSARTAQRSLRSESGIGEC